MPARTTFAEARVPKTRAIGYLRVSLEKQADHGISLEAQRAKVEAYAALYDVELVAVLVDAGESAKSLERPELQLALARLRRGEVNGLVVAKLDRLTRSVADLGKLIEDYFGPNGAALMCVDQQIDTRSAGGRLVLNVLASVSQWEREAIGERTAAVMQHMKAAGQFTGGVVPYGYRLAASSDESAHVRLEPEPREQEAIALAKSLRAEKLSLRAISRRLAEAGYLSRAGAPLDAKQVSRMVADGGRGV